MEMEAAQFTKNLEHARTRSNLGASPASGWQSSCIFATKRAEFCRRACTGTIHNAAETKQPDIFLIASPCSPWSTILLLSGKTPTGWDFLARKQEWHLENYLWFVTEVSEHQRRSARHAHFEHPAHGTSRATSAFQISVQKQRRGRDHGVVASCLDAFREPGLLQRVIDQQLLWQQLHKLHQDRLLFNVLRLLFREQGVPTTRERPEDSARSVAVPKQSYEVLGQPICRGGKGLCCGGVFAPHTSGHDGGPRRGLPPV